MKFFKLELVLGIFVFFNLVFYQPLAAQDDSVIIEKEIDQPPATIINDTLIITGDQQIQEISSTHEHSPRRASLYSAVFPGLGQAYNGKFWKIPILYAGLGTLVYSINWNHRNYTEFTAGYYRLLNWNPATDGQFSFRGRTGVTLEALDRGITQYRRDRDFLIILSGIVYLLNIADAMVDAHLIHFDMGEDLTMKLKPNGGVSENNVRYAGLSLTLNF